MGAVFVDIEVGLTKGGDASIVCVGAWRPSDEATLKAAGAELAAASGAELEAFLGSEDWVVGHNIEVHDWPLLVEARPSLAALGGRLIDTLVLNPLAFPRNPYHRLVKDYKLTKHALNDPVADSRVCATLYGDQIRAFLEDPETGALYAELLGGPYRRWYEGFLGARSVDVAATIRDRVSTQVCSVALSETLPESGSPAAGDDVRRSWAYATAWLQVAGGSSVLPRWVRGRHPLVGDIVERLRGRPCEDPGCGFCRENHDPEANLRRFFGFEAFRSYGDDVPSADRGLPARPSGEREPLQRQIVRALLEKRPAIAVLPTGGGKSLCYQLPAMVSGATRGQLTIVVSPLQSLMQDQVDALERKGYGHAASLTGRLTLPERRKVLDGIALGDVHLLFVAPEQLRNRSFIETISQREVGQWVIDEAHCLSKWGHDFRPDYLYIGRFIAEYTPGVPVHGFTATARPEVLREISEHMRRHLGLEPQVIVGGHKRKNLTYGVERCNREHRMTRIVELLAEHAEDLRRGGAIVFCARRKTTEQVAEFLQNNGWSADYFHAGRRPNDKRLVQDQFIAGDLDVIAATCAFGMGVDKSDVRLVIHANMPDSLENYLQEAGRAGRDGAPARCVLLYDEKDADNQFDRSKSQQITLRDFRSLYRSVRERLRSRKARGLGDTELVASAGEILRTAQYDEDVEHRVGFDLDDPQFDTKVRTALAWMEECEPPLLRRRENRVGVVQGGLKIREIDAIEAHLKALKVPKSKRGPWVKIAELLVDSATNGEQTLSADVLADRAGLEGRDVYQHLQGMRDAGILDHDVTLNAWVTKGGPADSRRRLEELHAVEDDFTRLVEERGGFDGNFHLDVPYTAALLREMTGREVSADAVNGVLRLWSQVDRSVAVRRVGYSEHSLRFRDDHHGFHQKSADRRDVCSVELAHLYAQIPDGARGVEVPVSFKLGSVLDALRAEPTTRLIVDAEETRGVKTAEDGLVALQRATIVDLEHGGSIFYPGMTLEVVSGRGAPGAEEFRPLAEHYAGQIRQVHIMREWAVKMADGAEEDAASLLDDYFELPATEFDGKWFAGREEELSHAATAQRREEIVSGLSEAQKGVVMDRGLPARSSRSSNVLVLAGPGSGKTKTLVHRIAWLIGIEREEPSSILVLSYNRSTGVEIRRRLRLLIGRRANRVGIFTFHALAMRIAGEAPPGEETDLSEWGERVLERATATLNDPDMRVRDRVVAGLSHILVDEYQDITAERYEFLSALVGRTLRDPERKLQLYAVGDDDQNVYEWQGASTEYIHRFREDYDAEVCWLVENWRSAAETVDVANRLIAPHPDRMKADHPIVSAVDWAAAVRRLTAPIANLQSFVLAECRSRETSTAVLVRTRDEVSQWARRFRAADLPVVTVPETGSISWRGLRPVDDVLQVLREQLESGALTPMTLWAALDERAGHTKLDAPTKALWAAISDLWDSHANVAFPPETWWTLVREVESEEAASMQAGIEIRTMHAAKGQEYDRVFVVAGRKPRSQDADAERRLHYVAVTRAKRELFLLEDAESSYRWFEDLGVPAETVEASEVDDSRDVVLMGAEDVDLGLLGRLRESEFGDVEAMSEGDPLELREQGDRFFMYDASGSLVGRLSASGSARLADALGDGWRIESARVRAFQRRYADQGDTVYAEAYLRERWEAVLPEVSLDRP